MFNEACILGVYYFLVLFSIDFMEADAKNIFGWALIGLAGVNILVNMMFTVGETFMQMFNERRRKASVKKAHVKFQEHMDQKKNLIELHPGTLETFQKQL